MARGSRIRAAAGCALVAVVIAVPGCGADSAETETKTRETQPTTVDGAKPDSDADKGSTSKPVTLLRADVLISSDKSLPEDLIKGIAGIRGVQAAEPLSMGSFAVNGRTLTVAAVDPDSYRRFTPVQTAQADNVWERVEGGEVAVSTSVRRRTINAKDELPFGDDEAAPTIHVGAFAPLSERVSAVVNREQGEELGLPDDNALLVSTGDLTPSALSKKMRAVIGDRAALQILALEFDVNAVQTALLTGTSVASVVGSFSYTDNGNGTINPDSGWRNAFIRTEAVPILGNVTCNKAMLPQLRAALTEIVQRGLADKINPEEYAGCYYPRYIGRSAANGLSLHSWGIAVDLNVPGNQRGTVGEIDRQVVSIFKKWGFAWGGDWSYTDPMHFEMSRVVKVG